MSSLSLPLCRSVISYKTDQKPLFSNDTVANAGCCCLDFFIFSQSFEFSPRSYN